MLEPKPVKSKRNGININIKWEYKWIKWIERDITSSGTISLSLTSCERDTLAVRWYSTNSFSELNLTTHKKNLPCASRKTLKCCTPSEHLHSCILEFENLHYHSVVFLDLITSTTECCTVLYFFLFVRIVLHLITIITYLTDNEKSPGLDSLIRIRNAPSCLFDNSFSASARVIRP